MPINNPVKTGFISPQDFIHFIQSNVMEKEIALFSDEQLIHILKIEWLLETLENHSKKWIWISKIDPRPTASSILDSLKKLRGNEIDIIIALGGGSSIDLAKATKAFVSHEEPNNDFFRNSEEIYQAIETKHFLTNQNDIPIIAVPTTAGTGSEMTKWATIWNDEGNKKYSIDCEWLYPQKAFLIPEFTLSLPPRITKATGLDALSHAIEAFWAKSSTIEIKRIALNAISLLADTLPKVIITPSRMDLRKKMLEGSSLAGLAFSQTRTTAAHSLSYPLTMKYHIDHGVAVALVLPEIMMINQKEIDISPILKAMNLEKTEDFRKWVYEVLEPDFPTSLSRYGVRNDDFVELAMMSMTKGRIDNNPVDISISQIEEIFKRLQ